MTPRREPDVRHLRDAIEALGEPERSMIREVVLGEITYAMIAGINEIAVETEKVADEEEREHYRANGMKYWQMSMRHIAKVAFVVAEGQPENLLVGFEPVIMSVDNLQDLAALIVKGESHEVAGFIAAWTKSEGWDDGEEEEGT